MSLPSQSRKSAPATSSAIGGERIASCDQWELGFNRDPLPQGRYDDAEVIRKTLLTTIKNSGMSRDTIADVMSDLLGRQVTATMLNAFTAESRGDRRWPAEFDRAFCKATGDDTLVRTRAEMSGLRIINREEADMLELGRAYLQREQANATIAELQAKYAGGTR